MAAIDFPAAPTVNQIFVAANGTAYRWTGTLWAAAVRGMIVSDTPPANPGPGQQWFNSVLGVLMIFYADPNTSQWIPAVASGTNKILQEVTVETGVVATGTTVIPQDDTIPQITEGDQYMTLAITPQSAISKLIIDVVTMASNSINNNITTALFQDATANALAVSPVTQVNASAFVTNSFRHVMTSGTTSATTFRVRVGGAFAGTTTFNGAGGARYYGGVMASSIVIREVTT